jgi:hypothetical protein
MIITKQLVRIEYSAENSNDNKGEYLVLEPRQFTNAKGEIYYSGRVLNRNMEYRNFKNSGILSREIVATFLN